MFSKSLHRCPQCSRRPILVTRRKDPFVLIAFQTACISLIFLNAAFIGDILYRVWMDNCFSIDYVFLILIALLNVAELMNNWVSIKKLFDEYTMFTFILDVFTLGIFYWQIHCLSKVFFGANEQQTYKTLAFSFEKFILCSWALIFICYIIWNFLIFHELSQKQRLHKNINDIDHVKSLLRDSASVRFIQVVITLFYIRYDDSICILILCTLVFISYTFYTINHDKDLDFFDALIK